MKTCFHSPFRIWRIAAESIGQLSCSGYGIVPIFLRESGVFIRFKLNGFVKELD